MSLYWYLLLLAYNRLSDTLGYAVRMIFWLTVVSVLTVYSSVVEVGLVVLITSYNCPGRDFERNLIVIIVNPKLPLIALKTDLF